MVPNGPKWSQMVQRPRTKDLGLRDKGTKELGKKWNFGTWELKNLGTWEFSTWEPGNLGTSGDKNKSCNLLGEKNHATSWD